MKIFYFRQLCLTATVAGTLGLVPVAAACDDFCLKSPEPNKLYLEDFCLGPSGSCDEKLEINGYGDVDCLRAGWEAVKNGRAKVKLNGEKFDINKQGRRIADAPK